MLPIYLYGNPILRKKAEEIDMNYPELQTLIDEMFISMEKAEGVGLAAPQIGQSIRIFVIDTNPFKEVYPDVKELKAVFINPIIEEEYGELFTFNEGCLSVPEIREDVIRKSKIKLTYTNEKGERKTEDFDGLVARIIQHEYDHLEGLIFTDKLSSIKKMIIKKKLNDIKDGKTKPKYKSKI